MQAASTQNSLQDLEAIVRQHRDLVMREALAMLGDFHRAEDVTQETFLEAFFSLDRLRDPAALPAWLCAIARHRCHRVLRTRDLELLPGTVVDEWVDAQQTPAEEAASAERRRRVAAMLKTLSPDLRDAATLFYFKQCTQRESAAFLGVPVSTLNNRLHAARTLLKERINSMRDSSSTEVHANVGRIVQVRGPIVDVRFEARTPDIFDALAAANDDGTRVTERMKVAQRLNDGVVRCILTGESERDALQPGVSILNTTQLGIGLTPWIGVTPMTDSDIQSAVRAMTDGLETPGRILETGIKPIDLFCPLLEGGTTALLGVQGVGRIVLVEELIHRLGKQKSALPLRIIYLVEPNEPDSVRGMLTHEKEYPGDVADGVETWWMLNEAAVDPDAAGALQLFDSLIFCSPILGIQGLFPAIDPLASRSRAPISAEHAQVAGAARDLLARSRRLMVDPILLEHLACRAKKKAWARAREFPHQRMAELSAEDRLLVARARKLERFLTTPFFVAERFNHRPGKFVPLEETIRSCQGILDGRFDRCREEEFEFIGSTQELEG